MILEVNGLSKVLQALLIPETFSRQNYEGMTFELGMSYYLYLWYSDVKRVCLFSEYKVKVKMTEKESTVKWLADVKFPD